MHQAMHKHPMTAGPGPQSYMGFNDPSMGNGEWPHTMPHPPSENTRNQLSVVTTVWGVTSTSQSGPLAPNSYTNTTVTPTAFSTGQQFSHNMAPQKYPPSLVGRQNGANYNGYTSGGTTMNVPGNVANNNDYQSPHSALSAAALVAAAATATATATASVVALQEKQQSGNVNNGHYGSGPPGQVQVSPYQQNFSSVPGPQRMPTNQALNSSINNIGNSLGNPMNSMNSHIAGSVNKSMSNMHGIAGSQSPHIFNCNSQAMMPQNRSRNHYGSPQQHLAQKRPSQYNFMQYGSSMQQCGTASHSFNHNQYAGSQPNQFPKQQQYNGIVQQPPMNSQNYLSQQQQIRPSLRGQAPPYGNQAVPYYPHTQMNGAAQQSSSYDLHYASQYPSQNVQGRNMPYQSPSIPANPTPPPLQSSSGMSYLSPNPDLKPTFPEMKPIPGQRDDELRLTFPVRDGVILAPFRLEHNLAVSNHVFHLKPSVHQTLSWRSDLELQLKCFHHEDRQMNTNWPSSVQVSVNATPLCIDRGENKTSHKPLYLKEVCQPGRNTIQITVAACCCSHLFLLQLVHRPTVRSVLQGLLRKRLLPAEHCIQKIKKNFTSVAASTNSSMNGEDGVEQTAIKVSLKCPITFKRITLPARGLECKHIQAFDLESYLQLNSERGAWRCPVCNKPALLEGLEVDQYIWGILTNLSNSDVEEVTIDATASWKPIPVRTVKEEHDGDLCPASKRFKAMSPSSMTMPTTSTWEMGQGLSPYPALSTPDIQSVPSGQVTPGGSSYNPSGGFDFHSQASDFSSPLSHLSESVSSLDPLAAMEKTLIHHEQQMGPPNVHEQSNSTNRHAPVTSSSSSSHPSQPATPSSQSQNMMHGPQTPHTPHTPVSGPPSVPPSSQQNTPENSIVQQNGHSSSLTDHSTLSRTPDLSDLSFDPAAVIEGEGHGQEGLNLLPESVDPMELLSYLDPPDLCPTSNSVSNSCTTGTSSLSTSDSVTTSSSNNNSDDLLALFEN